MMRVMPIQVSTTEQGLKQMKAAFHKNWRHYLQEALGLAIFMVSACFFSAILFAEKSPLQNLVQDSFQKNLLMGILMGLTALFIFYSPWTSPSGSQINPAVTLTFLRLGKMCRYDALFFIIFQIAGGTMAVYIMQLLMGQFLTGAPVNSAVTIPGKNGPGWALFTELLIAFITMSVVLFSSHNEKFKKYTRIFSGLLVCCWVICAGPVSGFGMNPARSFASALPSGIWNSIWIYLFIPVAGMLAAAEVFLAVQKNNRHCGSTVNRGKNKIPEPSTFIL